MYVYVVYSAHPTCAGRTDKHSEKIYLNDLCCQEIGRMNKSI